MEQKGFWTGLLLTLGWSLALAQQNVQITLTLVNPSVPEYEMQVVNQNPSGSGWAVDQLHVLYNTAGVLQSTSVPSGWNAMWDVPWDAIPPACLRFEANTASDRIMPGGARTFRFKMTTKTPVEDFYIQFRVVNGSAFREYVDRVKILSTVDVPADSPKGGMAIVPGPVGGLAGILSLLYNALYSVPATEFRLTATDSQGRERNRWVYPEAPIQQPPHLDHYFLGEVPQEISNLGAEEVTLCAEGSEWNGGAFGFANLHWLRDGNTIPRPTLCWQFTPSVAMHDGTRMVALKIRNCGIIPINGRLLVHLRGDTFLPCGADLANWSQNYPPDLNTAIELAPGAIQEFTLRIPAGTPSQRYFYGALFAQEPDGTLTRHYFEHQEVNRPLLVGFIASAPQELPVSVNLNNPRTGLSLGFTVITNSAGSWRIPIDIPSSTALFSDAGIYRPVWQVRVKPKGAISQTFTEVLLPGGDTLDPYLRMELVLGDVNNDDCIDDADLMAVLFALGQTGNSPEDLNRDGVVDDADLLLVLFNFGVGC